nr:hypothetical protein GCM10025732_14650 [Glycomyces mayteni]
MLVQNGVTGDSRVQKEAESAAAAGYEVVLLGASPSGKAEEWALGGATVRLVPVNRVFDRRRHEMRRGWLRSPLAYPPGPLAAYRQRQARAWRTDLDTARARGLRLRRWRRARPRTGCSGAGRGCAARRPGGWRRTVPPRRAGSTASPRGSGRRRWGTGRGGGWTRPCGTWSCRSDRWWTSCART